jgi:hypothetical protein
LGRQDLRFHPVFSVCGVPVSVTSATTQELGAVFGFSS